MIESLGKRYELEVCFELDEWIDCSSFPVPPAELIPKLTGSGRGKEPSEVIMLSIFHRSREQNDRSNDRQNETGRVKLRTWLRFGKEAADQSPDN